MHRRPKPSSLLALSLLLLITACASPIAGRTARCLACAESHLFRHSQVTAALLTGSYTFARQGAYLLRFEAGSATLNHQPLMPGCYVAYASAGDVLHLEDARGVHLEAPSPRASCSEWASSLENDAHERNAHEHTYYDKQQTRQHR